MKCPSCHEEAGLIVGDADFTSLVLTGLVANVVVTQRQFCNKCSVAVHEDRFRGSLDIPEAAMHLQHKPELCPESVVSTEEEDELEAQFRFSCSCGLDSAHHKVLVKLVQDAGVPWADK